MAVYQIMTDFLGLPKAEGCSLVESDFVRERRTSHETGNPDTAKKGESS
jgi:hypothetical protein